MVLGETVTVLEALHRRYGVGTEPTGLLPVEVKNAVRDDLPAFFRELGFRRGAEIGVWRGEFSERLCAENPELSLLCVDPWEPYSDYRDYRWPRRLEGAFRTATERLAPWHATILRKYSTVAAEEVPDRSLDFVYIDGNHAFEYVVADLAAWSPKVKIGGVISGHDYVLKQRPTTHFGVVEAVQGWTASHGINPWFVLGRIKVTAHERIDRERSFLWVNP